MKVYVVSSYDCVSNIGKVESVHKSFEGANEAMQSLADRDVGDGSIYFKHQDFTGEVTIHFISDEGKHNLQWTETMAKSYYICRKELLK